MTHDRDEWMRRLGPLYPGLVALCLLTRVPLPNGILPTSEDRERAGAWFPAVGALIGASVALVAAVLLWCGLQPALVAVMAQVVTIAVTGSSMLVGVAVAAQQLASPRTRTAAELAHWLPGTLAVVGFLTLRAVALMTLDTGEWTAALILSDALAYWAALFVQHIGPVAQARKTDDPTNLAVGRVSLPGLGMGSAIAGGIAVLVLMLSGVIALLGVLITAGTAFALGLLLQRRFGGTPGRSLPAIAGMCGLLVLLAFAAAYPTSVSPWLR